MEITLRTLQEIISHEAVVQEMYLDSVGVETWSVGVTNASGHHVQRYKDNPQPLEYCLKVFEWVLRTNYAPAVDRAFAGVYLTESQAAAALSFHYNTGGIEKAQWVTLWKEGKTAEARDAFMNWSKPPEIVPRRVREQALFFDGVWSGDGMALIYSVAKPSYRPDWARSKHINVTPILQSIIASRDKEDKPPTEGGDLADFSTDELLGEIVRRIRDAAK